jgi:soluble lytic murein transglycosylase-like protein
MKPNRVQLTACAGLLSLRLLGASAPVAAMPPGVSSEPEWAAEPPAAGAPAIPSRLLDAATRAEGVAERISALADQRARRADAAAHVGGRLIVVAATEPVDASVFDTLISRYAARYNLEPDLLRALIKVESDFNPSAVSPKGAGGLMQLMPDTAWRYGVRNIFDAEQNIAGGTRYFSDLLQMFNGNIPLALSAYNAGENLVARIQRIPDYEETRAYVSRIGHLFDFQRSAYQFPEQQARLPQVRRSGAAESANTMTPIRN